MIYDILTPDKSQVLDDLCDISDLTNIAKNPTCVMKGCEPSLVDVILTNKTIFVLRHLIVILESVIVIIWYEH